MNALKASYFIVFFILSTELLSQQVYKSAENGFEISIPDDWKIEASAKPNLEIAAVKEKTASMGVLVQKNSIYEGKSLDDFGLEAMKEIVLNEFENKYKNFMIMDYGNTEINENKAYYFKYSFEKSGLSVIGKQYMILKDGKMFIITALCSESEFKSFERILDGITYSFKFPA
jgi:hypothetical protein